MASLRTLLCNATIVFVLLCLFSLLPATSPQATGNSPTAPTVAGCGPSLLPLAPCAPFVQGASPSPAQPCCDNLKQLYLQQPNCLCLLLNDTILRSFPINSTLALELPDLCTLQVDLATCSGVTPPPNSPASQISSGSKGNSTVAATPMVTISPRPTMMGLGYHPSAAVKLNAEYYHLVMMMLALMLSTYHVC